MPVVHDTPESARLTDGTTHEVMRIGLTVARFAAPGGPARLGDALVRVARHAEAVGFDTFWVWDHFFWDASPVGPGVTDREMLEAFTTLGFIAGATRTIKLGTMVASATYRHPGVLIKQVTTLDVLSGGRAIFGIGAGWFEVEHRALGIPFPTLQERFERLEETVQFVGRNADAFVANGNDDAVKSHLRLEQQAPAIGHRTQPVCGEIPDDLLDLPFVGFVP